MKRSWAVILAAAALAGCRGSQPATNPFLRTSVPPPGTGEGAVVVPGEPYYPGAAPPGAIAPVQPVPVAPQPVVPPPLDLRHPPGGDYQYHQSSVGQPPGTLAGGPSDGSSTGANHTPDTVDAAAPGALALGGPSNAVEQALALSKEPNPVQAANYEEFGGQLPGEVLPGEQPNDPSASAAPGIARGALRPPGSTLRIVGANSDTAAATAGTPSTGTAMQVTLGGSQANISGNPLATTTPAQFADSNWSRATPTTTAASNPATSTSAAGVSVGPANTSDYAFTPDYTSLSGRLEYSQTANQWKLRYIPIDGRTDAYGGSVVLPNTPALAAYKAGDRVAVRGKLASGPAAAGSFSPLYQLDRVERLSP